MEPAVSLLGMDPKERKSTCLRDSWALMFTAAGSQWVRDPVSECLQHMKRSQCAAYMWTMDYYLPIKRIKISFFHHVNSPQKDHIRGRKQAQEDRALPPSQKDSFTSFPFSPHIVTQSQWLISFLRLSELSFSSAFHIPCSFMCSVSTTEFYIHVCTQYVCYLPHLCCIQSLSYYHFPINVLLSFDYYVYTSAHIFIYNVLYLYMSINL